MEYSCARDSYVRNLKHKVIRRNNILSKITYVTLKHNWRSVEIELKCYIIADYSLSYDFKYYTCHALLNSAMHMSKQPFVFWMIIIALTLLIQEVMKHYMICSLH